MKNTTKLKLIFLTLIIPFVFFSCNKDSVVGNLKTEEFARIRVGMENRGDKPIPLIDYVLQKYSKDELEKINFEIMPVVEENILKFLTKE